MELADPLHEEERSQLRARLGEIEAALAEFSEAAQADLADWEDALRTQSSEGAVSLPADVKKALSVPADKRTNEQTRILIAYRLRDNPDYARLDQERSALRKRLDKLAPPTTLVMREDTPRSSAIFQRGDFRAPGEPIEPSTPRALHPLETNRSASGERLTRLDLAQWLVRRDNPLVARVVVNRWWAELFGRGLVGTPEDFGVKGERPTHPELLDWLACEFMDCGWSQKAMLRTIVLSATYRQSSRITRDLLERDDRNMLWSRGPRHRLEAELIRDNALAIAGLLDLRLGGPPIRPYQPDGVWIKVGGQKYDYVVSPGAERYRRGLYVVWKRGAPYPSFVSFDANNRMACRVARPRSNTPLQALVLMNDPVYVEAAMAFARRVLTEQPGDDDARIRYAFRVATCREPRSDEADVLLALLTNERLARAASPDGCREFVGSFAVPAGVSAAEFTAWYAVAAALLNLDETITKE